MPIDDDDPYIARDAAAEEINRHILPVTPRRLRGWTEPATVIIANRACAKRSAWLEEARRRLAAAVAKSATRHSQMRAITDHARRALAELRREGRRASRRSRAAMTGPPTTTLELGEGNKS